ncbi:hypothetical protein, partial [Burkholderia multivorans]|uniref:hypothetical protein n=1 Tax=Burkholderia multivorans TaxID=87883 RepID=UPI0028705DF7
MRSSIAQSRDLAIVQMLDVTAMRRRTNARRQTKRGMTLPSCRVLRPDARRTMPPRVPLRRYFDNPPVSDWISDDTGA